MSETRSLVRKLAEVTAAVGRIPKNGTNKFHNYQYVMEADLVDAVRAEYAKRHLVMWPNVETERTEKVTTSSGKTENLVTLGVLFSVEDGESGEVRSFSIIGQGQDAGDKGSYKAMTGATKYALMKLHLIATGDDPETDSGTDHSKPAPVLGVQGVKAALQSPKPSVSDPRPSPPMNVDAQLSANDGRPAPITFRFGANKGKTSHEVSDKDLSFYVAAAQKAVDDPEKARFKAQNVLELAALQAEQRWRNVG